MTIVRYSLACCLAASLAIPASAQQPDVMAFADSVAQAIVADGPTASVAIGVKRGDDVLVAKAYGFADIENDVPATQSTVYRIGSVTKQFTAVAVLQLVEQGKLNLTDELTDFLPDYPMQGHVVTVHQLLTHISGIRSYTGLGPKFWDRAAEDLSHEEMIALIEDEPFDFAPGEKWLYNNSAFYLLGVIIEKASGQPYDEYLQEHIFGPLGMAGSTYCHERPIIKHRAQGYGRQDGKLVNDGLIHMNTPGAAGALCSTVDDLLLWQDALNNHQLITEESHAAMTTSARLNNDSLTGYGYGIGLSDLAGHRVLRHSGGIFGFVSLLAYYPDDDVTVVVLANTEGTPVGRVATQIARTALGLGAETVVDLPINGQLRQALEGRYELGPTELHVYAEGDLLYLQPGDGDATRLLYRGDNEFTLQADPGVIVTFRVEDGEASTLTLGTGGRAQTAQRKH